MKSTILYRLLLALLWLTACAGLPPSATPTSTLIADTTTPTTSKIWFPPTNTPTIFPTATVLPTMEQHPGLAELLFTDNFNKVGLWNTSESTNSYAVIKNNRLILSISQRGPTSLLSMRSQPGVGDFYAEATATISLCVGKDQYGMIFRADPNGNHYRFVVSCDGAVRLERSTSAVHLPLIDWLPTGDAPTGAPADVKLGVWAVGNEMRFFLNDQYQFTFADPARRSGTLGFFVYVNGADPITVSFSDMSVYSVSYVSPTPSPIPPIPPLPTRTPTK
jgi:hypothetical protein